MGLDITAYRKVAAVRAKKDEDDGYEDGLTSFYPNTDFPGRFDGLEEGVLYSYVEEHDFRAGSYGGYGAWREWLANLVGYPLTPYTSHGRQDEAYSAAAWTGVVKGGPFYELIDYSDCEGTIGPKVAAKLAKDFAEWDERAKAAAVGDYYERYKNWRKAFEMAADEGAVTFH